MIWGIFHHLSWEGEGNSSRVKVIKYNQLIGLIKSNQGTGIIKSNQGMVSIESSQDI